MQVAENSTTMDARGSLTRAPRPFDFERDRFAFANELIWEYRFDETTGRTIFSRREPKPAYAHRCFVLTRAARQFLYHARFDESQPVASLGAYRRLVREVVLRNPRTPGECGREVVFPGYESLRQFSEVHAALLKSECGGAWRSYVLRSHWRMIFPILRGHQARTARQLVEAIGKGISPIVHLVRFPKLSINHGVILFYAAEGQGSIRFKVYDPNDPGKPTTLTFDQNAQTFLLPSNRYWAGGRVDVIEIYRGWFL